MKATAALTAVTLIAVTRYSSFPQFSNYLRKINIFNENSKKKLSKKCLARVKRARHFC